MWHMTKVLQEKSISYQNSLIFVNVSTFNGYTLIERKESGLSGLEVITVLYKQGQDGIAILNKQYISSKQHI